MLGQVLQNEIDVSKVDLTEVLAPATIMVVSVTASQTKGWVSRWRLDNC